MILNCLFFDKNGGFYKNEPHFFAYIYERETLQDLIFSTIGVKIFSISQIVLLNDEFH